MRNVFVIVILICLAIACQNPENQDIACMEAIIEDDSQLGEIRNHACKEQSLSETIRDYTENLELLDFSDCPEDFKKAFKNHITAWKNMKLITDSHPDLRGEMHDLFDQIKVSTDSTIFKARLATIWSTWSEIENAMAD